MFTLWKLVIQLIRLRNLPTLRTLHWRSSCHSQSLKVSKRMFSFMTKGKISENTKVSPLFNYPCPCCCCCCCPVLPDRAAHRPLPKSLQRIQIVHFTIQKVSHYFTRLHKKRANSKVRHENIVIVMNTPVSGPVLSENDLFVCIFSFQLLYIHFSVLFCREISEYCVHFGGVFLSSVWHQATQVISSQKGCLLQQNFSLDGQKKKTTASLYGLNFMKHIKLSKKKCFQFSLQNDVNIEI